MATMPRTDRQREYERAYRARKGRPARSRQPTAPHQQAVRSTPPPLTGYRRLEPILTLGPYAIVLVPTEGYAWLDARRPAPDGLDACRYAGADAAFESLCCRILATLGGPHP
jgi:hypothetical protein